MKTPNRYTRMKARMLYTVETTTAFEKLGYVVAAVFILSYVVSIGVLILEAIKR